MFTFKIPQHTELYSFGRNKRHTAFLEALARPGGVFCGRYSIAHHPPDARTFFDDRLRYYTSDNLIIGSCTQFARDILIISNGANHHTAGISPYNFTGIWGAKGYGEGAYVYKGPTVIGDDVWIGYGAIIMPGVNIGDGAIVGARSVVTKDVPAYALAVGIPARVKRMRYDDETIARLRALRWWEWPANEIGKAIPLLAESGKNNLDLLEEKGRKLVTYPTGASAIAVIIYAHDVGPNLTACLQMLALQIQCPQEVVIVSTAARKDIATEIPYQWVTVAESEGWQQRGLAALVSDASYVCVSTENDLLSAGYLVTAQQYIQQAACVAVVGHPEREYHSLFKRLIYALFGTVDVRGALSGSRFGIHRMVPVSSKVQGVSCARGPVVYQQGHLKKASQAVGTGNNMMLSAYLVQQGHKVSTIPGARWWPLHSTAERLYGRTVTPAMIGTYKRMMKEFVLPDNRMAYLGYLWICFGLWLRQRLGR